MKRTDDAVHLITSTLKGIFANDYSDVPKMHLYSHYAESILISLLNARRLKLLESNGTEYAAALERLVSLGLLSSEIASFAAAYPEILVGHLQWDKDTEWDNPHSIHEGLLGRELNTSTADVWFSIGKVSRDSTGSYYTPGELAIEVVREAVEKYLRIHRVTSDSEAAQLLAETKFADLSCGCGEFIKAVQKYLRERYQIAPEAISTNLYGIDIDPIALQITVCDLLEQVPESKWAEIISHFVLGNPLIDQPNEKSLAQKTSLFATGRYYAADTGINMARLFDSAGIDVIIGNPPWGKIRFEERKFFRSLFPEISSISQKDRRQAAIEKLKYSAPACYEWYQEIAGDYQQYKKVAKHHPFIAKSLNGELNTYALFTELSMHLIDDLGVLTLIVKSAIVTSPANKPLFNHMTRQQNLASVCLFDNTQRIFSIDSREKFCVITCSKRPNPTFELIAGAKVEDLRSLERNCLSAADVNIINPYTCMIPNISKGTDVKVLLDAHRRLPLFDTVYPDCHFGRLIHLTAHAQHIDTKPTENNVPIYEGKFIERYDARFATFAGLSDEEKCSAKAHAKKIPPADGKEALPESRYFIREDFWNKINTNYAEPYMLGWRSLTSTTNARTTLAMVLPTMPTCQSIQFLQTGNPIDLLMILALFNSKPFDYLVRLKMPGIDLTQSVIRQIPVPNRNAYQEQVTFLHRTQSLERHILERVGALLSQEPMVSTLMRELPPADLVLKKSKSILEKELDELFSIAYGLNNAEKEIIQASFKKK